MDITEMYYADVIDSRDVIARIEELEELTDISAEELTPASSAEHFANMEELEKLTAFRDKVAPYCDDWEYGESLIAADYFTEYTKELVSDCYELKLPSFVEVDWEATAEHCKVDYTTAELEGVTFYFR